MGVQADEIDAGWTGDTGIGVVTESLSGSKLGPGSWGAAVEKMVGFAVQI